MIAIPTSPLAHVAFDLAGWLAGVALSVVLYRWRLKPLAQRIAGRIDGGYFVALVLGALPGAWVAGSMNSLRGPDPALSHSVVGALVGAIAAIEIYKAFRGIRRSTGGVFTGPFAAGVVIGRLGCFFAGKADGTYGVATRLPWGVDLGDHVSRHPVQLYESLSMAVFLTAYIVGLARRDDWAMRRGFYALCMAYGAQRFAWEFLKPYPKLIGPFNLFHVLCAGLVAYGWIYDRRERAQGGAVSVPGPDHQPVRGLPGPGSGQDHRRGQ
ncbi:prolipoprotein diacylglyceryl transferase family protein [uncultured Caulobacter sp.]|uniref:prolipoprotein diacylglyceryl transferase family protein n=1 Tax=uncultured Caulobacter sp. TaxID=158749 RepID=UPI0026145647|nr:prolipoprotein diacylglyceryl transferase family protein [uncultured Caulobacter sp.]